MDKEAKEHIVRAMELCSHCKEEHGTWLEDWQGAHKANRTCKDCKQDTHELKEYYMVKDKL